MPTRRDLARAACVMKAAQGGGFCGAVVGALSPEPGGRGGRCGRSWPRTDAVETLPLPIPALLEHRARLRRPGGAGGAGTRRGPGRGGAQARQQTIERRFPVAIPDLGIVVGYMFIMHHERTPPQDNFINEIFKIVDGKIREIDAVGFN